MNRHNVKRLGSDPHCQRGVNIGRLRATRISFSLLYLNVRKEGHPPLRVLTGRLMDWLPWTGTRAADCGAVTPSWALVDGYRRIGVNEVVCLTRM